MSRDQSLPTGAIFRDRLPIVLNFGRDSVNAFTSRVDQSCFPYGYSCQVHRRGRVQHTSNHSGMDPGKTRSFPHTIDRVAAHIRPRHTGRSSEKHHLIQSTEKKIQIHFFLFKKYSVSGEKPETEATDSQRNWASFSPGSDRTVTGLNSHISIYHSHRREREETVIRMLCLAAYR